MDDPRSKLYDDICYYLQLTVRQRIQLQNILKNSFIEVSDRHAVNIKAAQASQIDLYKEAKYSACRRIGEMIFEEKLYDCEKNEVQFENQYFRHTVFVLKPAKK